MKLRAVGQCVPKCNFEIKQIPCLNKLPEFGQRVLLELVGIPARNSWHLSATEEPSHLFRWIRCLEMLPTIASYLILQFYFCYLIFWLFPNTEIFLCVWYLEKEARNKPNIFSAITCYKLRAITVSKSGSGNIVPVLKPIAVSHAVILAGISRGATV